MKRRIRPYLVVFILLISLVCLLAGCANTENAILENNKTIIIPENKTNAHIYDFDNVINDNIERKLNVIAIDLKRETNTQLIVMSVPSLSGISIEEYSDVIFNTLDIDKQYNSILFLLAKTDNKVFIDVGKGLETTLYQSRKDEILEDYFIPYFKENYSKATEYTVEVIANIITEEYGVKIKFNWLKQRKNSIKFAILS